MNQRKLDRNPQIRNEKKTASNDPYLKGFFKLFLACFPILQNWPFCGKNIM